MALSQANRLRYWRDFQTVYQKGNRLSSRCLSLRCLQNQPSAADSSSPRAWAFNNKHESNTRIGISISQKVSKKAVIRNRIKRQLQAIMRQFLPRISPGWDIVIVVRPGAKECDYARFLRELKQLLVEAEVLNGH
ncbi:MAG: ribonuclease P protein component [Merismopedia sp. SIO2A8]|nr:ribonuclease P protein component [Symploca sp. SIO2B6]NET50825.1 ribonuclease P protein component [Merismopedia sp. SIO2A8]